MASSFKKHEKTEAKRQKKAAKAELKSVKNGGGGASGGASGGARGRRNDSPAVRFAESVRAVLSILLGTSLIAALFLGQRGAIISLDDIIDSLFAARAGKIVLAIIGLALLIYGLKILRVLR